MRWTNECERGSIACVNTFMVWTMFSCVHSSIRYWLFNIIFNVFQFFWWASATRYSTFICILCQLYRIVKRSDDHRPIEELDMDSCPIFHLVIFLSHSLCVARNFSNADGFFFSLSIRLYLRWFFFRFTRPHIRLLTEFRYQALSVIKFIWLCAVTFATRLSFILLLFQSNRYVMINRVKLFLIELLLWGQISNWMWKPCWARASLGLFFIYDRWFCLFIWFRDLIE